MSIRKSRLLINRLIYFTAIYFAVTGSFQVLAQVQVDITAQADKTEVALDEILEFTITVEGLDGSNSPEIKLNQLEDNFSILATAQSSNINISGTKFESSLKFQYSLLPKREGELKIPSVAINYKGKVYNTEEIVIKVSPVKGPVVKPSPKENPHLRKPWSQKQGTII